MKTTDLALLALAGYIGYNWLKKKQGTPGWVKDIWNAPGGSQAPGDTPQPAGKEFTPVRVDSNQGGAQPLNAPVEAEPHTCEMNY